MWTGFGRQLWKWRGVFITAPSVAAMLVGFRLAGWLQPLELAVLDLFFQMRPPEPVDARIVIVEITESDIRATKQWPMSDALLAELLEKLNQQQPRAIGLDLYRDLPVEPGTQTLTNLFKSTPNLVGIQKILSPAINPPLILKQQGQVSANDAIPDFDGKVRRLLLTLKDQEGTITALGTELALRYLQPEGINLEVVDADKNQYKLGKAIFTALDSNDGGYVRTNVGGYQLLANFRNLQRGFRAISMTDVLEGRMPANFVRDRIVLIGITAESSGDFFATPYSSDLLGKGYTRSSGVSLHADLASQLISAALEGRPQFRFWSELSEWLWIAGWSCVGAVISWAQRYRQHSKGASKRKYGTKLIDFLEKLPLAVLGILTIGTGLTWGSYLMFLQGWWIPVVPGVLALVGSAVATTAYVARSAAGMRQTLGRYLADPVVANLLETPGGLNLGGERRKVTILMSDLRGFSALSERIQPEQAVTILNHYLEVMADVIYSYGGTINEIMGDGLFVIFGAPIQRSDDAERAVACAIAMQLAIIDINKQNQAMNLPPLEMGIGINTGEALAGNIGSQKRAKYAVVGSPVNLASRIESYTVGGQILISKETFIASGSILKVNEQMQITPKGFQEPISIYDIGGVGGQYNLVLPKQEEPLAPLKQEIPLQFTILEGKQTASTQYQGSLVKLSAHTAELHSEHPLVPLSNLKMNLLVNQEKAKGLGDIYAKVMEQSLDQSQHFYIRFTAIPPEIDALFHYLCQSQN